MYIPVFSSEPCFTGFQGVQCHANKLAPDVQQPPAVPDIDRGDNKNPCPEDEQFFESRQDAETTEEAISLFMDGMEAYKRCGFKDLHILQVLGRLPVPTVKASQAITQICIGRRFSPVHDLGEQKQFTPFELHLYKHALKYSYKLV